MKFRGNKGQGAMEYLMTYGWAILVVMIVGVVLWQLGVFDFGQGSVVTKDWDKIQPLPPTVAYNAIDAADDMFSASFNNVVGTAIRITAVNATEDYGGQECTPGAVIGTQTADALGVFPSAITVSPGEAFSLDVNCTGATLTRGDQYLMNIEIYYTAIVGGISVDHIEIGTIRGDAE